MLVHKFGGTSVANAERLRAAAGLVLDHARPAVVVVSAMAGVTDKLIELAESACDGQAAQFEALLSDLRKKHQQTAKTLTNAGPSRDHLTSLVETLFLELRQLLTGVHLLRELTPRSRDLILSFGERLAAPLFAAALQARGLEFQVVDARDILRTDSQFGKANVDLDASRRLTSDAVTPLAARTIPVITGFIGRTADGLTTTLGRGGSDYTASLIGSFLEADEIIIWTDVDGVMTADPRVVREARVLDSISYREAAEMAFFGSKVLHPSTMIPAELAGIPIRIRNSLRPEQPGTLISERSAGKYEGVKTVSSISEMAMVSVEGKGMIGVAGVASRVFTAAARAGVNVYMISQSSSEQNISFIVRRDDGPRVVTELEKEFELERLRQRIDRISVQTPVGILAIIGEGMRGTPGISQRLFTGLGRARINVLAIAQGSSELNVSVVVDQADLPRAVGATHTRFGLTRDTQVFLLGKGLIGRTLLRQLLASRERLRQEHGISLNVIGVCGKAELLFDPAGIDVDRLTKIADGVALGELQGEPRPTDDEIIRRLSQTRRLDIALVDVTAADTGPLHVKALQHGMHIVTANKKTLSASMKLYEKLRATAFAQGLGYYFETTFGAGLPVLFTLQDLLATHDRILRIGGCLSGTLGYICTGLQQGRPFSEMVREAKSRGYTEPDPRDDLSGVDVARKALIIAREIGAKIEMDDIDLQGLVPPELMALSADEFMARLPELDAVFAERVRQAESTGKVLRFLAEITPEKVSVGLREVDRASAEGQLQGPDNILVYQTERYRDNPLVIRGPGAGAEVTAAGVFGDLLKVARQA
jgi:aspartokinase/homoserine dehydrogenase 1